MALVTTPRAVTVELSPQLKHKVAWFMNRTLQSLSAKAGEKVKLICGHSISRAVLKELPGSTLSWTFNMEPLTMDPSRVFFYKENLDITDLVPSDSGVYECVVTWGADDTVKQNLTLGVFSLEIETDTPTRYVFENEPTKMDCHSVTLGNLFPEAVRYWLYNGTHTPVLPVTKASNSTPDVITSMRKSMVGVWECQVMQPQTERVWAPAWYNLSVQDPPSSAARVFRHIQVHWYTMVVVLTILLIPLVLLFCFSAYKMKRIEDDAGEKFLDERQGWEDTMLKHCENGKINVDSLTPPPSPSSSESLFTPGKLARSRNSLSSIDLRAVAAAARGDEDDDEDDDDDNDEGDESEAGSWDNMGYNNFVGGGDDGNFNKRYDDEPRGDDDNDESDDYGLEDLTKNATCSRHDGRRFWKVPSTNIEMNFLEKENRNNLLLSGFVKGFNVNKIADKTGMAVNREDSSKARSRRKKRMTEFGKILSVKPGDKNFSAATRQDAIEWLEHHSSMAKQLQGRNLPTQAPYRQTNQQDDILMSLDMRENSNTSNVNWQSPSETHIPETSEEFELQAFKFDDLRKDVHEDTSKPLPELSSKQKACSYEDHIDIYISNLQRKEMVPSRGENYMAQKPRRVVSKGTNSNFSRVIRDTEPSSTMRNYSTTLNKAMFPRKSSSFSKTSWKNWLVSKLSERNNILSTTSRNNSSLWLNRDVKYTALSQSET